jgi:hypothetical protein
MTSCCKVAVPVLLFAFAGLIGCNSTQQQAPSSSQQETTSADHHGWLGTETVKARFGDFEFKGGYPTAASATALLDQLKFNRAIEVYLTQIPAVAVYDTREGFRNFGARQPNQFIIWEQLMNAKTLLLTRTRRPSVAWASLT